MITEIICEPYKGENNKYYYMYKIINSITNEFYYGVHSTNNLNDDYSGSGWKLNKQYNKFDKSIYKKYIIEFFNCLDDAFNKEAEIVNPDLLNDKLCLNMILGGKNHNYIKGLTYINNSEKTIKVNKELANLLINSGKWKKGRIIDINGPKNPAYGKRWIKRNDECIYVDNSKVQDYLNNGWEFGFIRNNTNISKPRTWINNGKTNKKVLTNDVDYYLNNEWKIGRINYKRDNTNISKPKRWITNGIKNKRVLIENVDIFINNGWKFGRLNKK